MAQLSSPLTTYSDTTLHKRAITDVISMIDPNDTPLIANLGGLDGASGKFNFVNTPGKTVEWAEDTLYALADSITETIATDTTTLTVADATVFQEGDIALIGSELIWVSAVTNATSIVATRAFGSSTAATAADNAVVTIVGNARLEGDDSDDRGFTDRTTNSNYTQIFHEEVKVSRTERQIAQYGIADEFEYQSQKLIPSMLRLVERNLFYGTRNAGSATTPRTFGGLPIFITDNTVNYTTSITQANIEDALEASWTDGGIGPWVMPVGSAQMQVLKNIYDNTSYLRVPRSEGVLGMVVSRVETPFGDCDFLLDRWARTDNYYIIDPKHAGMITLYPFTMEPLAKTGDADRAEVVGEFSFALRQDKAHAVLT